MQVKIYNKCVSRLLSQRLLLTYLQLREGTSSNVKSQDYESYDQLNDMPTTLDILQLNGLSLQIIKWQSLTPSFEMWATTHFTL